MGSRWALQPSVCACPEKPGSQSHLHSDSHKPLTACVASIVEGSGVGPRSVGPVQESGKHGLSVITGTSSAVPHECRLASHPVSHLSSLQPRLLPWKLPTGKAPPLALCHFVCPMCPVLPVLSSTTSSCVPCAQCSLCCPPLHAICPPSAQGRAPTRRAQVLRTPEQPQGVETEAPRPVKMKVEPLWGVAEVASQPVPALPPPQFLGLLLVMVDRTVCNLIWLTGLVLFGLCFETGLCF